LKLCEALFAAAHVGYQLYGVAASDSVPEEPDDFSVAEGLFAWEALSDVLLEGGCPQFEHLLHVVYEVELRFGGDLVEVGLRVGREQLLYVVGGEVHQTRGGRRFLLLILNQVLRLLGRNVLREQRLLINYFLDRFRVLLVQSVHLSPLSTGSVVNERLLLVLQRRTRIYIFGLSRQYSATVPETPERLVVNVFDGLLKDKIENATHLLSGDM